MGFNLFRRKKKYRPKIVECFLESEKKYKHIPKKNSYAAFLTYSKHDNCFKRYFINSIPRIWDQKHKTYWVMYEFPAQVGYIIEFRGKSGRRAKKQYYQVTSKKRNNHLKKISREKAYNFARKLQKVLSKKYQNYRPIPSHVRSSVWQRDKGRCNCCGSKEMLEFDHIIPFSWGGSNSIENIQLLCRRCNRRKSDSLSVPTVKLFNFWRKKGLVAK